MLSIGARLTKLPNLLLIALYIKPYVTLVESVERLCMTFTHVSHMVHRMDSLKDRKL